MFYRHGVKYSPLKGGRGKKFVNRKSSDMNQLPSFNDAFNDC